MAPHNDGQLLESFGEFLNTQEAHVGEVVEVLAFFLADATAQLTDHAFDQGVLDATKDLVTGAYRICCDLPSDQDSVITTH